VLLATMVSEPVEFSSALVSAGDAGPTSGYGVGDALPGDATILEIGQTHIRVRRADGRLESIGFPGAPSGAAPEAQEPASEGIQRVETGRFAVPRAALARILEDPQQLAAEARAVPHEGPDGRVDGYRLSGIRQRSTLHQLGIRNGDVVHGMNGQPLTSLTDAMGALEALRSQEAFTFELTRRTKRQTFEYEVR
jgi:type II secretion system protein C